MKPTEICLRLAWRAENWRRSEIRVPLPKELVRLAWKARVGYSWDRSLTHFAYVEDWMLVSVVSLASNFDKLLKEAGVFNEKRTKERKDVRPNTKLSFTSFHSTGAEIRIATQKQDTQRLLG